MASLGETGHPRASSARIDVAFRRDIRWHEPYQVRLSASSSLLDGATEEVRDGEAGKRREKVISIEGLRPWRPDRGRHTRTHVDGQTRIVDAGPGQTFVSRSSRFSGVTRTSPRDL